jgi:phospholipid/cholesterol/gamma-HCH transport system substrate-binding protein
MPQRQKIAWAQLRVGALVIVSLTILAIGIFFISGEVRVFSRKFTLKTYFNSAAGLRAGSQVRIKGVPVGTVDRVRISQFPEPSRAVEVIMRIPRDFQSQIRVDSEASLQTAGLLGEAYVDISRGGPGQPVVPDGGEIKSREEADIKRIMQNTNDVISNLRELSEKLNDITSQIQAGKGSIGKLIHDEALYNRMNQITGDIQHVVSRLDRGEGTVGKLMVDETLYQRTLASIERLDRILDDVQTGKGSLAKFLNDPSVYDNVSQLVARANTLMDNVNKGQGTLGKLATDPQLYNRMNETLGNLNTITDRIEKGEGTLGKLSTDPSLFANLSESSQSLKEFLTEFRKNPKKYLTVKLRLFW